MTEETKQVQRVETLDEALNKIFDKHEKRLFDKIDELEEKLVNKLNRKLKECE